MVHFRAKFKSYVDKASPYFRPFLIENLPDKCLLTRILHIQLCFMTLSMSVLNVYLKCYILGLEDVVKVVNFLNIDLL